VSPLTLIVVAVVFGATLVRSALGFGEALIAVPLLAFALPVTEAAPLAALMSITVSAVVVASDWRHVQWRSAAWLVLSTFAGIPVGLLMLRTVPEPIVKAVLGAVVGGFAASRLFVRNTRELHDDRHAWLFGVAAGVLGGAYGMNGPPLVVYGSMRRWTPDHFRATLQGYFLPASLMGMVGYWSAGLWTPPVSRYYLLTLPAALLAIALGRLVHQRLDARRFFVWVHAGLFASGIGLMVEGAVSALRQIHGQG